MTTAELQNRALTRQLMKDDEYYKDMKFVGSDFNGMVTYWERSHGHVFMFVLSEDWTSVHDATERKGIHV